MGQSTPLENILSTVRLEEPARVPIITLEQEHSVSIMGIKYSEFATDPEKLAQTHLNVIRRYGLDWAWVHADDWIEFEAMGNKIQFFDETVPQATEYAVMHACMHIQRLMFWTSILNGAAGYTYGANGIWNSNTKARPFGPSPHGYSWGDISWKDAYKFCGSAQIGMGKRLLEQYRWWLFEPHPEWSEPHWNKEDLFKPYAAGIPGEVRFFYFPYYAPSFGIFDRKSPVVRNIELDLNYHAFCFDPRNGREYDLGTVAANEKGEWQIRDPPIIQDWVLVMRTK